MGVRLAYGRREDVEPAIQNGLIPNETLIVTAETLDPEILYYNANNQLITPLKRARFETYEEADQWVKEYPSVGCIIAVRDDTAWAPYIVQEGNILSPLKTGGVIYFDTEQILTNEQQLQARQNINAASENLVYVLKDGETIDDVPDDAVIIYDPADEGLSIEGLDILAEVNMRLDKLFETMPSTTSDLVNDSGFITVLVSDLVNYYSKSETYSRSEIDSKISLIPKFKISVVSSLPASGINETTVYLLSGGNEDNLYTEYIYVNGKWEILGSQHIDLVGYATESWVIDQLSSKLDANKLGEAIEIALEEAKASGEFDGASDVYIGDEASMPAGTKVRINPNGQRMKIPAVDDTLSKAGYTADAKVVGEKFAEQSKSIEEQAERTVPTYTLAEGETPEDAPEWAEEVIDPYNDPEDGGVSKEEFEQLSEAIADKATLENGVITFWKAAETEDGTDTELFTVDISSVGGSGGLDLNNLTLSVTQVGEYQRLSMSDGATTKTVDIPITAINDTQVKSAVYAYLDENPPSNTKKVTENDLRIYFGWKFALGDLSANTTSYSTYSSNAPFWMPAGTVLTKTINAKVEIFRYTGDTSTYANGFALAKNWTTAVGTTYEIPSDGWYVFLHWGYASSAVPAVYTAERTGVGGYAAIQKPAFTFEYTADVDFEPAYQFTVDWNCPGINISTTAVEKYTNGLYKACHRQPGYPCYMHTQTNGSIWGRYLVWADLTTTTHSAGYSSDLLSYKDELWIITTGSDTHDYLTNIMKIKVYENGWVERLGEIHTNLGHINAIRYDEETDTLTWGNGSGNYELEGEIYIINNFSNSPLVKDYASDIILWDDLVTNGWIESLSVPVADYGFKANFIGFCEPIRLDVNTGRRLTTVLLTNDGNTIRFGEITPTLNDDGSHTYSLTNLTWTKTQDIGDTTETQTASYNHCVQGMDAYNGRAIWGNGHSCVWLASYKIEPASLTTKPQISTTKINRQDMMLSALNARGIRGLAVQGDRLYLIQDGGILWYDAKVADRI